MNVLAEIEAAPDQSVTRDEYAVMVHGLTRQFSANTVLRGLNLRIRSGEFAVLLGRSGSGKSTLLRTLAGLDPAPKGALSVPAARAVVFQEPRLLPWKRVWQNVTLGLRVPRLPEALRALATITIPVMQSSANESGQPDARTLAEVPEAMREGADLVLDGGELGGTPSTVIDLRDLGAHGRWHVLREGALARGEVEAALAKLA